jgi:hypothetical protein
MKETQVELWNDMKNKEETQVELWNDMKNKEETQEQTFTINGLVYRTHLEWRKSIIVIQCSGIINSVKVGSFKIYFQNFH